MNPRPKVLFFSLHNPCGPAFGARIRVSKTLALLERFADVSLVLLATAGEPPEQLAAARRRYDLRAVVPVERRRLGIGGRLRKEFDPRFMAIRMQALRAEDRRELLALSRRFDICWFHTVKVPDTIGVFSWPGSVLDVDDLASQVYATQAATAESLRRRLLDYRMSLLWRRRERLFLRRFDALCVCSEQDRAFFGDKPKVFVVRNGFDLEEGGPGAGGGDPRPEAVGAPRLGLIGSMDYLPNRKGAEWFTRAVWPLIKAAVPDARLRLVGRDSERLELAAPDVDALGWVADAAAEIATWSAMVVPIRHGGGTRIKIAEGFARGCPVVSTRFGAYGYRIRNGREALLADTAEAFAAACIELIRSPGLRRRIAASALDTYRALYTWQAQAAGIAGALRHCLDASAARGWRTIAYP